MEGILGCFIIYATVHLLVMSYTKEWSKRTKYEKAVSIIGTVTIGLAYLAIMLG
jgi:hypothetical protein